jgi:hypothetical protein
VSQAQRHAKQVERQGKQIAQLMQQRHALAPKPMAVYVRMALRAHYGGKP